jgi:hypothetical protein
MPQHLQPLVQRSNLLAQKWCTSSCTSCLVAWRQSLTRQHWQT